MGLFFRGWSAPLPVKRNLNASAHQDILDDAMLSTLWEQFVEGLFYFSVTVTQCTKQDPWLDEFGVEELELLTQSPDLNPIQHLWDELKQRLHVRPSHPTSVPELTNAVLDEWAKIPLQNLVQVFPE